MPPDQVWKVVSLNDPNIVIYFQLSEQKENTKRVNITKDKCVLSFYLSSLPEELRTDLYRSALFDKQDGFIEHLPIIQEALNTEEWNFIPTPTMFQTFYNSLPNPIKSFFGYISGWF